MITGKFVYTKVFYKHPIVLGVSTRAIWVGLSRVMENVDLSGITEECRETVESETHEDSRFF